MSQLESIKDPNVVLVTSSPTYDPSEPLKNWQDLRAKDPGNTEDFFSYKTLVRSAAKNAVVLKPFVLDREAAGAVNVPPPGINPGISAGEVPFPVRDLAPEESAIIDPFGKILIVTKGQVQDQNLLEILGEINQKLDQLLTRCS